MHIFKRIAFQADGKLVITPLYLRQCDIGIGIDKSTTETEQRTQKWSNTYEETGHLTGPLYKSMEKRWTVLNGAGTVGYGGKLYFLPPSVHKKSIPDALMT